MKKPIVQSIRKLADELPTVFEEHEDFVDMTGEELKLTPYADRQPLLDDLIYPVPIPKYIAVDHYQQLKDALKKGGVQAVEQYANLVMLKHANSEQRNLPLI
jgi:hypothetical protein